jgi:hypothetical protein
MAKTGPKFQIIKVFDFPRIVRRYVDEKTVLQVSFVGR